jgi:hypothetical protein
LLLGVAFACNFGGMLTPISSLQNVLACTQLASIGIEVSYGRWVLAQGREAARFLPLHGHFERWLSATVRILDENLREPDAQLSARLLADPDSVHLLVLDADRAQRAGDEPRARALLRRAIELQPDHVPALARLGAALRSVDEAAARDAILLALRGLHLPRPWPEESMPGAALVTDLESLLDLSDPAWEQELQAFLSENVRDCCTAGEGAIVEAAAQALARAQARRGDRQAAQRGLQSFLDRALGFSHPPEAAEAHPPGIWSELRWYLLGLVLLVTTFGGLWAALGGR